MAKIAVLGHGVVGSGVVEVLTMNQQNIKKRTNQAIEVKRILDLKEFNDLPYADKFTKDFNDILNDDEISIVCEVMGGVSPAYEFTKACLEKGKSVVTSNKELVAQKGGELLEIASKNNTNYYFEASVGGGIPIIRPLNKCLAANNISEIMGILNGTTNFILTKMIKEQMTFEDALKLAQDLGYAERDPSADIEGSDACRKICILSSIAYGKHVYPEWVHTSGITNVSLDDVVYAENWGGVIKLIGRVKMLENGKLWIMVCPAFIPLNNQLSNIQDVYNGVLVHGNVIGDTMFYGQGAGKLPTASAVVADVIDAVKSNTTNASSIWGETSKDFIEDYKDCKSCFYIRLTSEDRQKAAQFIDQNFGDVKYLSRQNQPDNEIAFITQQILEGKAIDIIHSMNDNGMKVASKIRVFE